MATQADDTQDAHLIAYPKTTLPGLRGTWRGKFDKKAYDAGNFFTCLGAAQTQGRFVEKPFVDLLAKEFGLWGINLGLGGAAVVTMYRGN